MPRLTGQVAIVRLNAPQSLNALSSGIREILPHEIPRLLDDSAVRCLVITGPGADIPGVAERLSAAFGLPVMVGRPQALVTRFAKDASRLTLSYGLGIGAAP